MQNVTRRSFFRTAGIAAAAPVFGSIAAEAQQTTPANLKIENDVVYGKGGDMDLHLDIFNPAPDVAPRRMAVIHIHGGGFTQGSKAGVAGAVGAALHLHITSLDRQFPALVRGCCPKLMIGDAPE